MRYVMKQKLFTLLGDDFVIRDDSGEERFVVKSKMFTLGNQLSFQDTAGNEVAYIRQKLLAFGPTYEIHRDGQVVAKVSKELFTLFSCAFTVDVPGPDDLEAKGDFSDHDYTFRRHGEEVAWVSKKWLSFRDTYGVDIAEGEDDVVILASTVVMDMACHPDEDD